MKFKLIVTNFVALFIFIFTSAAAQPSFQSSVMPIPTDIKNKMLQYTWHPGCPVAIQNLVYLKLNYWGFDHQAHGGEMIINKQLAGHVVSIFRSLYEHQFPIEKMHLIEEYEGNDEASLEANNTAAFNCRLVTGSNKYSQHSYGCAIDINPLQNPYVRGIKILPRQGKQFLSRNKTTPGLITKNSYIYQEFKKYGWQWGGDWKHLKDYHHFEKSSSQLLPNHLHYNINNYVTKKYHVI